jgi:hypothetical protein
MKLGKSKKCVSKFSLLRRMSGALSPLMGSGIKRDRVGGEEKGLQKFSVFSYNNFFKKINHY